MIPIVRLGDITFGVYKCESKPGPRPATGMVITIFPSYLANSLGIGQMGVCMSAQPCPLTPFNLGIVGSPTSLVGGAGILRLGDPVTGIGAGGTGIYTSGSPDALSG